MSGRRRKEELSMLVVKNRKDSRLQKVAKSEVEKSVEMVV